MRHLRGIAIGFVIGLAALHLSAPAGWGKVLHSKKIDRAEMEKAGATVSKGVFQIIKGFPGWSSAYNPGDKGLLLPGDFPKIVKPLAPGEIPADNGTMVWWFYYDGGTTKRPGSGMTYLNLLTLADDRNEVLLSFYLLPRSGLDNVGSAVQSNGWKTDNDKAFGRLAQFKDPIPAKRWSYVAITWGPDPQADNRIYLNGIPAMAYSLDNGQPASAERSFGEILGKAAALYIGSDPMGYDSFPHGAIGEYEIHDEILTKFDYAPRGLPAIRSLNEDSFKVAGISGKLVAGDRVNVTLEAEAGGQAVVDFGVVKGISLAEDPAAPGRYAGVVEIPPGLYADGERAVGRFTDASGIDAEPLPGASTFSIDSRSRFTLSIDKTDLPADSNATARVKVKVTDANGAPIEGHKIKVTLATTDEYTGLVGGGSARAKDFAAAAQEQLAGAEVETRWKGVTDAWGEVDFDFKAGFAAKTIILQAKDMTAGDVGVDYITSFKEASIDIALTPPRSLAAARRGMQYIIKVEATRTELTADGRSRSVIRATVYDPNGAPVAGDPVAFSLSSPNGTLRTINGTTDASGVATAEYIAGKKIGIIVVTATDTVRNISDSVSILLLADAPAKIHLFARPDSLPADGISRADISVKVTDINDNPNKDTKVEYKVSRGGGRIEYPDRTTDTFGDAANRYTAGTTPGIATVVATVRSKVPTEAELGKAREVLFVPESELGEEIKVQKWLKRVGETALKGEPVVEYTVGRSEAVQSLKAPYDCRIDFQTVEYWDTAQTGDTLALITPVVVPGSSGGAPAAPRISPARRR